MLEAAQQGSNDAERRLMEILPRAVGRSTISSSKRLEAQRTAWVHITHLYGGLTAAQHFWLG